MPLDLASVRAAQARWAAEPVRARLRIFTALRHNIAESPRDLAASVPLDQPGHLHRSIADTLCSEVIPLADACRFIEREAPRLLATRRQPKRLRPLWLKGVTIETRREPLGIVFIIGPGNYPLFLPGTQALQALAAGNAVLWKPAPGGKAAAQALRDLLVSNGLDAALLTVLEERPQTAQAAIEAGVDKVILTGSAATGRTVLHALAEKLTPSVMELSGCDAVFILDGADLARAAEAIAFGLRFNGSATCMAPRRLIVSKSLFAHVLPKVEGALRAIPPVPVPLTTRALLAELIAEATELGAQIVLNGVAPNAEGIGSVSATLIARATPAMRIAQAGILAPVLTFLLANSDEEMLDVYRQCPCSLTASVFGPRRKAEAFAARIPAGTVLVNDLMVSTADPRVSFGGRGISGFGSTRGEAGLLEMTAVKNVIVQRAASRRTYQPTTPAHEDFFTTFLRRSHGRGWRNRYAAWRELIRTSRNLDPPKRPSSK